VRGSAILLGLLLTACRVPLAQHPSESTEAPRTFVEVPPEADNTEDPAVARISAGDCPSDVDDVPRPYFNERVLIRLPRSVDEAALRVHGPGRARLLAPILLPTCVPGGRPVALEQMILQWWDLDPGDPIEHARDEVLSANGLLDDATLIEAEVDQREGEWVFERSTEKLLVVVHTVSGNVAVVIYVVASEDWPLVVESLRGSGQRVSLVPR
jgi:hypothetical protein